MAFWQIFSELCDSIGKKPNPVGKELGIASATITQWKNGSIPSGEKLVMLANYFNVSTDYLLSKTDEKVNSTNISNSINPFLSEHEIKLIDAYRSQPNMQDAVDRILGIVNNSKSDTVPEEYKIAAYGGDNVVKHSQKKPKIT